MDTFKYILKCTLAILPFALLLQWNAMAGNAELSVDRNGKMVAHTKGSVQIVPGPQLWFSGHYDDGPACNPVNSATTITVWPGDADCGAIAAHYIHPLADVDTSDNDKVDVVFNSLPPGVYEVTVVFTVDKSVEGTVGIYDGVDNRALSSSEQTGRDVYSLSTVFEYNTTAARTFSLAGAVASGSQTIINQGSANHLRRTTWKIVRYPQ